MLSFYNADIEVNIINKAFENTLGWSLEELREIDIMAQCYPEPGYRAKVTEFMMRADGTWQDLQTRTRTGNILFTSWANVRLPDGSTVGIGKDITERKRAEAEILRSKDLLESIFNESADAIFLVNAETLLITDCNRRAVDCLKLKVKTNYLILRGGLFKKNRLRQKN
jgi:PAS domain S-box-containing protein